MKLSTLIVPITLIAALALFAPHAGAQTMGEYAAATAGVASGGGAMGTSISPPSLSNDGGGGSSTWSANGLGASFEERAGGSASGGDFESRAGGGSRWPESRLNGDSSKRFESDSSKRFGDSSKRFGDQDRFPERAELSSSSDRFNDNRMGLDTNYNRNELDASHSSGGLDNSYNPN